MTGKSEILMFKDPHKASNLSENQGYENVIKNGFLLASYDELGKPTTLSCFIGDSSFNSIL